MMTKDTLCVRDNGQLLTYTYADVLAYHGGGMPGGVALAFRMLQWVFDDVFHVTPERGQCTFYTGLGHNGQGIMDTAKLILGVTEENGLFLDIAYSLDKMGPEAPGGGRYYFEVGCENRVAKLAVKDGVIPNEFFALSTKLHQKRQKGEVISEEETEKLKRLRFELSQTILAAQGSDLFVIV